jgi:transcription antitermination factor NusA-like protein
VGQKRGRDADDRNNGEKKAKTRLPDGAIELRAVVSNYESGVIIGTKGSNVKTIREKTSCLVSILKSKENKASERILSIKGLHTSIAQALLIIAELVVQDKQKKERQAESQQDPAGPTETTSLKLLVHRAHTGAVIGNKGAIVKEIAQTSGARIQLSNEPLSGSTEKTVTITGTPSAIHQAALRVLTQINDNPLKTGTPYLPYVPVVGAGGQGGGQFGGGPPGAPGAYPYPGPGFDNYGYGGSPYPQGAPPPRPRGGGGEGGPEQQQKIAIPTTSAGSVIGKGGTIIADIKSQTGTNIRIAPPDAESPHERVVTVSGGAQGIQAAVALIRQRVENPHLPWTGGAPAAPASYPMPPPGPPPSSYPNPYGGYYQ